MKNLNFGFFEINKKPFYKVRLAWFPFSLILRIFRGSDLNSRVAMINPFTLKVITIGDPYLPAKMYAHEVAHIEQVVAEGRIKFVVKYLWYNIRYGYYNNPYEVAARKAENNAL